MTTIILPSPIDELARATLFDKLLPSTFDKRCGPVCDTKRDGDRLATQHERIRDYMLSAVFCKIRVPTVHRKLKMARQLKWNLFDKRKTENRAKGE